MAVSLTIVITQNSQSVANNTSNVTVKVNASWTNGSYNLNNKSGYATINGTKYTFTNSFNDDRTTSGTKTIYTKTLDISHASDGTKKLSVSASYTTGVSSGTIAASASKTLTTIPRKSTMSVGNGTLGSGLAITVTQKSSSFTHSIKAVCGSSTYYIKADGTTSTTEVKHNDCSFTFTPPLAWASQNTTGTSVSVKYTLTTYNGSTNVGSNSYTKTCSIPSSVKPSCTVAVSDPTGYASTYGGYVKGKSKMKVVITPTTSYGSAIASYGGSANGQTLTAATTTTSEVTTVGTNTINASVKDRRGRSGTASTTVTVLDYSAPRITALKVIRCNSITDTTENIQGEALLVTFSAEITSLNSANAKSYTLRYRPHGSNTWINASMNYNAYSITNGTCVIGAADVSKSYEIMLTATDSFGSTQRSIVVSTGFVLMHWNADGDGLSFGKISERDGLEIGMNTYLSNGKTIFGVSTDQKYLSMMQLNANNHIVFGYGGYNNSIGRTYLDGNEVVIRSKNHIETNSDIYLPNAKAIYNYFTDGSAGSIAYINGSDNTVFGYGGYSKNKGRTNVYGNAMSLNSNAEINITSPTAGLNNRAYGVNKQLWSGAVYMKADHTATLSEAISAQPNGVLLAFSYYDGSAQDYDWNYAFIPKWHVANHSGKGVNVQLTSGSLGYYANKYLYISDTTIKGYANNNASGTGSDISYQNAKFVMRYVIGV